MNTYNFFTYIRHGVYMSILFFIYLYLRFTHMRKF